MLDSDRVKKIRSSIRAKSLQKNIHENFSISKEDDYSNFLLENDDIFAEDTEEKFKSINSKIVVAAARGRSHSIGDISKMISGVDINSTNYSSSCTEASLLSTLSGPTVSNIKSRSGIDDKKLYEEHKSELLSERLEWEIASSSNDRKYCHSTHSSKQDYYDGSDDEDILPPSPTCLDIRSSSLPVNATSRLNRQKNSLLKRCHTFSSPGHY